ncbi:penicillin-binding protein 1A [Anopheles sinensis]|uniref:Penicillin-binding protein 1A n=1 Tax=Anopheles sinensis TaxID=74873 RepID=A0A084W8V6_ANOSI|nr:penicillin-binding protein 1A [Anopheles sinensis]
MTPYDDRTIAAARDRQREIVQIVCARLRSIATIIPQPPPNPIRFLSEGIPPALMRHGDSRPQPERTGGRPHDDAFLGVCVASRCESESEFYLQRISSVDRIFDDRKFTRQKVHVLMGPMVPTTCRRAPVDTPSCQEDH